MTGMERRTKELADAIGGLTQDYADEISWDNLNFYKPSGRVPITSTYDGCIPVQSGREYLHTLDQKSKSELRYIIKQINFLSIFYKMGELDRPNKVSWSKILCLLYLDAIEIFLGSICMKPNVYLQVEDYLKRFDAGHELTWALVYVQATFKKSILPLQVNGAFTRFGYRNVKGCELALRLLIELHSEKQD